MSLIYGENLNFSDFLRDLATLTNLCDNGVVHNFSSITSMVILFNVSKKLHSAKYDNDIT